MVKKLMESTVTYQTKRAGYTKDSVPSRLNIKTSYQQALGRQLALKGAFDKKIKLLLAELEKAKEAAQIKALEEEIEKVKRQARTIPFFEDVDLRYNNFETVPTPVTSAVMFCIMDVSASMGQHEKDIAKRFFTLLYIFLTRQYKEVELVFIRHHTEAKEVDEEEFFNSRESGGTVVAPSLKLMQKIIAGALRRAMECVLLPGNRWRRVVEAKMRLGLPASCCRETYCLPFNTWHISKSSKGSERDFGMPTKAWQRRKFFYASDK